MSNNPADQQVIQSNPTSTELTIPLNIDLAKDSYTIKGGAGVAVAHIKKPSGEVHSIHVRANGGFQQMTIFNPNMMTITERRSLESNLHNSGHTQSEIADLVGVSQPTVAYDLKKLREEKDSKKDDS